MQFPAFGQKVITLTADVSMLTSPPDVPLTDAAMWLKPERFIEIDDPRIQALALELKRPTAFETANAIYTWVAANLTYAGYLADDFGAVDALDRRRGDCTEYAYLAVALARANRIPARMVGGYVLDRNTVVRSEEYHNWAELYIGGTWRLLDAQKRNWLTLTDQYVIFHYHSDQAFNDIGLAHRFRSEGELHIHI